MFITICSSNRDEWFFQRTCCVLHGLLKVTEMEEYIKQLQIIRNEGEATYQVLIRNMVKEMSKPAANLIHALSFQPTNVATDFFQYSDQALHEPSASFTESTNQ